MDTKTQSGILSSLDSSQSESPSENPGTVWDGAPFIRAPRRGSRRRLAKLKTMSSGSETESEPEAGNPSSTAGQSVKIRYVEPKKYQLPVYTLGDLKGPDQTSSDSARFTTKNQGASRLTPYATVSLVLVVTLGGIALILWYPVIKSILFPQ